MSRAGYSDDYADDDPLQAGRWRAQVLSSTRGRRGQRLLRDMLAALDAMPDKRLTTDDLEVSLAEDAKRAENWARIVGRPASEFLPERAMGYRDGDVCALGALGRARGLDMSNLDPDDPDGVADAFDIAAPLAREIVYVNDECSPSRKVVGAHGREYWTSVESPEQRWQRMRDWVASQIIQPK